MFRLYDLATNDNPQVCIQIGLQTRYLIFSPENLEFSKEVQHTKYTKWTTMAMAAYKGQGQIQG